MFDFFFFYIACLCVLSFYSPSFDPWVELFGLVLVVSGVFVKDHEHPQWAPNSVYLRK